MRRSTPASTRSSTAARRPDRRRGGRRGRDRRLDERASLTPGPAAHQSVRASGPRRTGVSPDEDDGLGPSRMPSTTSARATRLPSAGCAAHRAAGGGAAPSRAAGPGSGPCRKSASERQGEVARLGIRDREAAGAAGDDLGQALQGRARRSSALVCPTSSSTAARVGRGVRTGSCRSDGSRRRSTTECRRRSSGQCRRPSRSGPWCVLVSGCCRVVDDGERLGEGRHPPVAEHRDGLIGHVAEGRAPRVGRGETGRGGRLARARAGDERDDLAPGTAEAGGMEQDGRAGEVVDAEVVEVVDEACLELARQGQVGVGGEQGAYGPGWWRARRSATTPRAPVGASRHRGPAPRAPRRGRRGTAHRRRHRRRCAAWTASWCAGLSRRARGRSARSTATAGRPGPPRTSRSSAPASSCARRSR